MTNEPKLAAQERVGSFQRRIVVYRQDKVGHGGELDQIRDSLMTCIVARIFRAIRRVPKRRWMVYVLDKNEPSPTVLSEDGDYAFTYEALDVLNRQESD